VPVKQNSRSSIQSKNDLKRERYISYDTHCISCDSMSIQVNIRLEEDLLGEIDALTKVLHMSRTEWIRMKIAQALQKDTLNLTEAIALEYAKGRISDKELKNLLGTDAKEIRFIVKQLKKGKKEIDQMIDKGIL
jgi:hypothetical protein